MGTLTREKRSLDRLHQGSMFKIEAFEEDDGFSLNQSKCKLGKCNLTKWFHVKILRFPHWVFKMPIRYNVTRKLDCRDSVKDSICSTIDRTFSRKKRNVDPITVWKKNVFTKKVHTNEKIRWFHVKYEWQVKMLDCLDHHAQIIQDIVNNIFSEIIYGFC